MSALAQRERTFLRSVGDEPLPGYRLIAPLGVGGFGEVWKCLAPGGLHKAVKFVSEDPDDDPAERTSLQQEYDAFERVKGIRHPFLLTLERVELIDGELVMVMELADRSLGHRYDECRDSGLPGIPRNELLSYMVDAAEALDVLGREHGLQHLDVKPANLFLLGGHVKVGDYGLVARHRTSLGGEEPKLGRGLTPKYVAPEILSDRVHARSDQYPLALVYQELLTGSFPYSGRTARQLLLQHSSAEPDLMPLPAGDREAVGRALSKNPIQRFPTCLSFVKALLRTESPGDETPLPPKRVPAPSLPRRPALVTPSTRTCETAAPDATMRFNPTVPNRGVTSAATEPAAEFERTHPGWTYTSESPPTAHGRAVRATDAEGSAHSVHLLKLPTGSTCDAILAALAAPVRGLFQIALRPHRHALSLAVPDKGPSLKEWMALRKAAAESALRRAEIRAVLAPIAATLDALHTAHGFAHGLLSASTVIQSGGTWGVTLFGPGELLRRTRGDRTWMQAESYAAPEAAEGKAEPASDLYSLALLFLELAGAWAPPERRSLRTDSEPAAIRFDRDSLHGGEAAAIRKALATKPADRFRTCAEFLAALVPSAGAGVVLEEVRAVECQERLAGKELPADAPPLPARLTDALLRSAGASTVASWPSAESDGLVVKLPDGRLSCRFPVKLTAELALMKLTAFQTQHGFELVKWKADTYALKPLSGKPAAKGIELVVQLPTGDQAEARELSVIGRAVSLGERSRADEQIILIIEQFRRAVQNTHERRRASRFRTELPILVYPVDDELAVGAPIAGVCRDVSGTGFACILPGGLVAGHSFVTFPTVADFGRWTLLAQIVRTQTTPLGTTLVAGRFVHAGT